jgi:hypothetical protein
MFDDRAGHLEPMAKVRAFDALAERLAKLGWRIAPVFREADNHRKPGAQFHKVTQGPEPQHRVMLAFPRQFKRRKGKNHRKVAGQRGQIAGGMSR